MVLIVDKYFCETENTNTFLDKELRNKINIVTQLPLIIQSVTKKKNIYQKYYQMYINAFVKR